MTTQEAIIESRLIKQLVRLGYATVKIHDGDALVSNLKSQLQTFKKGILQQIFV